LEAQNWKAEAVVMWEIEQAAVELLLPMGFRHECPYLPGRCAYESSLYCFKSRLSPRLYRRMLDENYRRSGRLFYRPECEECSECRTLRVPVDQFRPNRSQRRCWRKNQAIEVQLGRPVPSEEKYDLYRRYLTARHDDTMEGTWEEMVGFLYDSPVPTFEAVYWLGGRMLAVGITDVVADAASAVYCYFEPAAAKLSLGVFNVLWWIEFCRRRGLRYLYLGHYIAACGKMNYKANFRPCELLTAAGQWERLER